MPMHRMKLSWRRKKGSGKRDREEGGGTAEEAKSWGKREGMRKHMGKWCSRRGRLEVIPVA